jgi:hypothetical protein
MKVIANQRTLRTVSILLVLLATTVASAKVIYVDCNAPGANDGTSWQDAYNFLQDALADANSLLDKPVEIRVAQGRYTPDSNSAVPDGTGDRHATFRLISGAALKGGYAGFGQLNPDARDIKVYETILSGDLDGNDVYVADPCDLWKEATRCENSYHVVIGSDTDPNALLDGFTVTGGNANGTWDQDRTNCGGGMLSLGGRATLVSCTFRENSAGTPDYSGAGGGMDNDDGSMPTVTNCKFCRNYTAGAGGGMGNLGSGPTLTNCRFIENFAYGGGGMENTYGEAIVIDCTFSGNRVSYYGGGMYNYDSGVTMTGCLFVGNSARYSENAVGGAISNWYSDATLKNCTLVGNRANRSGSAMEGSDSNVSLANCIIWANSPGSEGDEIIGTASITYSDVQGGWSGDGNIDSNPCFAEPGYWDASGTTDDTDDDSWVDGDYHLKSQAGRWDPNSQTWVYDDVTSPCIDAGNPQDPVGRELFPNGMIVNIGIYGGTPQASMSLCPLGDPADCSNDGIVDANDLLMLGEHWLAEGVLLVEDINRDGVVDFADFAVIALRWLQRGNEVCISQVFFDSFEIGEWNHLWTEDNQNDWFRSKQRAIDGAYSAGVDGPATNATLTSVPIDLQGIPNATVSFWWYIEPFLDKGEYLVFEISTDGGANWVEKARFEGDAYDEGRWRNVSIELKGITSLRLRFKARMSDSQEDAYVDMVKVVAHYH